MGYTTFTCSRYGDSYKGKYADATGHKLGDWITTKITTDSEGSRHKECENCEKTLETDNTPKLYLTVITDTHGEAIVGGYLVIVTDTDTKNPVSGVGVALDKNWRYFYPLAELPSAGLCEPDNGNGAALQRQNPCFRYATYRDR